MTSNVQADPLIPKKIRAIGLDGGGYLGLATAALLAEAERHFNCNATDAFDLFCGTSTGGIIALGLASGLAAHRIVDLYCDLGKKVFRGLPAAAWKVASGYGWWASRYMQSRLAGVLKDVFGDLTLGDLQRRGKFVAVPAFCLTTGAPRVFKTNHATNLTLHNEYLVRDVALATSAAPTYFPAVSLSAPKSGDREVFIDGGIFANNPALIAYTEAIFHLGGDPRALSILSVSTPTPVTERPSRELTRLERVRLHRGKLQWATSIHDLFIRSGMQLTEQAMRRLMEATSTYERIAIPSAKGLGIDKVSSATTKTLIELGTHQAASADGPRRLAPFFSQKGNDDGECAEAV